MPRCRLIDDGPRSGVWNMAADEYLLQSATGSNNCVLRLYQWSEPTLSLGYFQRHGDRQFHAGSRSCPLVRRSSGGGAIVHDQELTYCFVTPVQDRWFADHSELYTQFHQSIMDTLSELGVTDLQSADGSSGINSAFLCFQRNAVGDILIGTEKVVGSAQRRSKNALLQHGSILWRQSPKANELPGIADLSSTTSVLADFIKSWPKRLATQLVLDFHEESTSNQENGSIEALITNQFGDSKWSKRR